MSVRLQALRSFPYASKRLKVGEQFNATGESDATLLCAIGHATRHVQVQTAITDPVPAAVSTKRGKAYRTQALEAQPSSDATPPAALERETPEAQASEYGIAEKPGAGDAEAAQQGAGQPAADAEVPARKAPTIRRNYQRRDMAAGDPE